MEGEVYRDPHREKFERQEKRVMFLIIFLSIGKSSVGSRVVNAVIGDRNEDSVVGVGRLRRRDRDERTILVECVMSNDIAKFNSY